MMQKKKLIQKIEEIECIPYWLGMLLNGSLIPSSTTRGDKINEGIYQSISFPYWLGIDLREDKREEKVSIMWLHDIIK